MDLLQLDVNQCSDQYYVPNAFKDTHKCDKKSSYVSIFLLFSLMTAETIEFIKILYDLPGFAREIKVQDIINLARNSLTDRECQTIKNFFS